VQFFEDVFWINLLRYVSFLNQYCPADPQSFFNTIGHGETNSLISSAAPQLPEIVRALTTKRRIPFAGACALSFA
jgi:hypothetical protein